MRGGDKRARLMAAAERMFASRRFHEITLDEVVRLARVSKGSVYTYFSGKDDLFFHVATSGFDELCALLRATVSGAAPFRAQLVGACEAVTAFFRRRRPWLRMMQSEEARMAGCAGGLRQRWTSKREHLVSAVADILRTGAAEGEVRNDLSPGVLANLLLGMLRARARYLEDSSAAPSPADIVDLFMNGAGRGGRRRRRPA